jgi:hypothetical protein
MFKMRQYLKLLAVTPLWIIACDKSGIQNSSPLEGFSYTFELVDSTGEALAKSIENLPFDPQETYFLNTGGDRLPLRFHPPRWSYENPQWNYDSSGYPLGGIPDSIGVSVEVYANAELYYANEVGLKQFTWYIFLDPTAPPDTFTVYDSGVSGVVADSAKINGLLIPTKEATIVNGRLIPWGAGLSRLVYHYPIYYP